MKQHPEDCICANCEKIRDNNRAIEPARRISSELAPASWLDALIESYERNISIHKTEYEHTGNKYYEGAADAYRDVLNDLRAERRSASNEKLNDLHQQTRAPENMP